MTPEPRLQLSGNTLKIFAAVSMLLDHAGLLLFPGNILLRILGRLAFPIFAFMIAEGCRYTHNKARYLGNLLLLAVPCQIVYAIADGGWYFSILFTFSLSIVTVYVLQYWRTKPLALSSALLWGTVATVYLLNRLFVIDYGFWGCMVPVFAALPQGTEFDTLRNRVLSMSAGLVLLSAGLGSIQFWCLAAVPLLLLYSGKRGKRNMKAFFYIFYPVHLAALQVLAWILA